MFIFPKNQKTILIHINTDFSDPCFFSGILIFTKSVLKSVF